MSALDVTLTVGNPTAAARSAWPVISGVPIKAGALNKTDRLHLTDAEANEVPLQWTPLCLWPDGSVKWALLDFQADVPPQGVARYRLRCGEPPVPDSPVKVSRKDGAVTIDTGALKVFLRPEAPGLISGIQRREGHRYVEAAAKVEGIVRTAAGSFAASAGRTSIDVESRGPMRAVVAVKGEHQAVGGKRCFSFVLRIHAFAGLPLLKLEYMVLNDNPQGVFTKIREVRLDLDLDVDPRGRLEIGGFAPGKPEEPVRLLQQDDTHCVLSGLGDIREGEKAPGWMSLRAGSQTVAAVTRDFWQQWPKSLEVDETGVSFGLFPALEAGQYEGCEPLERYYYLFSGRDYLLKTGVAKRHELWLGFEEAGTQGRYVQFATGAEELCTAVNRPLMAVADPSYMTASGAFGDIIPAGRPEGWDYDRVALRSAAAYRDATSVEREYGVLNWGDWFGERQFNWGNGEYDPAHAFFLLYARTGDVQHFWWGEAAAKHQADVDILHAVNEDYLSGDELSGYDFPVGVGAMYLHAFGHVGGYLPLKKAAQRFPKAYTAADPRNLGHVWNEGLLEAYYLTGDPWVKEAALQLADYLVGLAKIEDFTWWFGRDPHCGRVAGWPLHALMAAYNATGRRQYLQAARSIIDLALADQDPNCGGWLYRLYPGHCFCERPHVGMAEFITSVLLSGMIEYHMVTDDRRVAESIVRAVDFLIADTWDEIEGKFRYTSCPASSPRPPDLCLWPIAYAYRLAYKPVHRHVLRKAWTTYINHLDEITARVAFGKSFAMYHRSAARVIPVLELIANEGR
jgi:hypothetical protein